MQGNQLNSEYNDNRHRTLQELVSVNAWFVQDKERPTRFTLHADVSFNEERLGGGEETNVIFKLAVKRCDIIFEPPSVDPFRVDPATVRMPQPLNPKSVLETSTTVKKAGGRATLRLNPLTPSGEISADVGYEKGNTTTVTSQQDAGMYREMWKKVRGNHAWSVSGKDLENGRLAGPVFDGKNDPRLTLLDGRPESQRARDFAQNNIPVAVVRVRCLREDIDIYDIQLTKPEKQSLFSKGKGQDEKMLVAREVLKEALLREGLVAGDISTNPYAEMTICDVAIKIIDSST
ncbi:hypothetical protein [Sulfitobacter pontiacus]|uniref:hypothetical protein n=1 Tax=Sulfitobacter pontiacus TaxID=60137 RepID=UPI0030EBDE93